MLKEAPFLNEDTTTNDSDKTVTIPSDEEWDIWSIQIDYTSTATAGNRQLVVLFTNDADAIIHEVRVGVTQAASLNYFYNIAPGVADLTTIRDTLFLTTPMPLMKMAGGWKIRVYDNAAIAAAADDMEVRILYVKRTVR